MRRQRNGIIVNINSIAGKLGFPLTSAYVSSKFALEGLSESMAYEIEELGIKVILIEPGVIKTNFNKNIKIGKRVTNDSNSPYGEMTQKRISRFKPRFESGTPPIEVAKVILKTITSAENQQLSTDFRFLVGNDALKLMEIRNNMSDKEFRKIVIKGVL